MNLRTLCVLILVTLPLTRSGTLPLGFPLKVYEPLIPIALLTAFSSGRVDIGGAARFVQWWLLFWISSVFTTALAYSLLDAIDLSVFTWATGRYAPPINALYHSIYLALDITLLVVLLSAIRGGILTLADFARTWTLASLASVCYAVGLNLVHWFGLPPALLLRWDSEPQIMNIAGLDVVRTGPFEEGNYFGLYLLLSLGIALWGLNRHGDRLYAAAAIVLSVGIFMTASPAAVALGMSLLVLHALRPSTRGAWRTIPLAIAALGLALIASTNLLQEIVIEKFSLLFYGGVVASDNVSLFMRVNESYHAWQLFLDHPFGVGIGAFGYFWGEHPELFAWMSVPFEAEKLIPNNVWLEILSEQGLVGMACFLMAMGTLARGLRRQGEHFLGWVLAAMLVYFVAFPSFRLMFLWGFWAFVAAAGHPEKTEERA